jgi:hypothetical protein
MSSQCVVAARRRGFFAWPALLCALALLAVGRASEPTPPVITSQTGDLSAYEGDRVTLGVTATGTAPLSYLWSKDGTNLVTLTNASITITAVTTNDVGVYQVVVSNAVGTATSQPMQLTALPNVARILVDLEDQTVVEGAFAAVGVTVNGATPLYYFWYKDGIYLTNVFGPSILFAPVALTNAGAYQVVVTNSLGAATSRVATVTVKPNTLRQLRTSALEFPDAASLRVPVEFAAQGNENALGFSVRFNAEVLLEPAAAFTDAARALLPLATFVVDESEAPYGRLGFRVNLPPGLTMPTQTFRLVDLYFQVPDANWFLAGLAFASQPVPLAATDATNAPLPVLDFVQPQFTAGPLPARPDPQSGLFLQRLTLINAGAIKMDGVDVLVRGLTNDSLGKPIQLYNASGSTNGVPFVHYGPLPAGGSAELIAEYYVPDRRTLPTPEYEPRIVPTRLYVASGGQVFAITTARFTNGVFILDFQTLEGREYFIQYVNDLNSQAWQTAVPGILGTGSRVQWVDRGPPKTQSAPTNQTSRFYRGMLMP